MSSAAAHDLTAAYVLDALEPDEARAFERHAAGCPVCRRELDKLAPLAAVLALAAPPAAPPPELRARVLADARRPGTLIPLRRVASTAAAIAAAALVAVGIQEVLDRGSSAHTVALVGARGSLVVLGGGHARLVVDGLPHARPGRTYEAWLIGPDGAVPAGLFAGGGSPTVVPLFRRVPEGARVAVTLERAGGVAQLRGTPLFRTKGAA